MEDFCRSAVLGFNRALDKFHGRSNFRGLPCHRKADGGPLATGNGRFVDFEWSP